jgi:hypothetical protein
MYEITGTCKVTNKRVRVAIADSIMELRIILREECRNYYQISFTRLCP